MTVFFTSDEHHGHKNIIEYCRRPYRDTYEQTVDLIARHNARVGPGDVVWHLGDFSLQEKYVPWVLPLLNGSHRLVLGNHDAPHPSQPPKKREGAWERYLQYGFKELMLSLQAGLFDLCHFPHAGDSRYGEERFSAYRPKDESKRLLHGHVHNAWRTRDRMINVGVDVWDYAPVSLAEILAI